MKYHALALWISIFSFYTQMSMELTPAKPLPGTALGPAIKPPCKETIKNFIETLKHNAKIWTAPPSIYLQDFPHKIFKKIVDTRNEAMAYRYIDLIDTAYGYFPMGKPKKTVMTIHHSCLNHCKCLDSIETIKDKVIPLFKEYIKDPDALLAICEDKQLEKLNKINVCFEYYNDQIEMIEDLVGFKLDIIKTGPRKFELLPT